MLDVLLTALSLPLLAMSACAADPAIVHVSATQISDNGQLAAYDFAITVKNNGTEKQPSSVLQSVVIYQDATKVDQKGAQPLAAGASETVHYRFSRSNEARMGSTHMRFQLIVRDPHQTAQDCNTANNTYRLNV
jgi:subtilase family serine protease